MGDMREEFAALKERTKERKAVRFDHNLEVVAAAKDIPIKYQSSGVYRVDTPAGAVMYYPATNCWQHKGKTYRGDGKAFTEWYRKQTFARPQ